MKPEPSEQFISISVALVSAVFLHILLALILTNLPLSTEKEKLRTIPTVFISTGSRESLAMQQAQSKATNSAAANAYLASLEESIFKVQQNDNKKNNSQHKSQVSKPSQSTLPSSEQASTSITNRSQALRAQKANQGMMNIFKKQKTTGKTQQISTKEYQELSDYEISLRSILSRAVFYDQFHRFIKAKGNNRVDFEVTLILLPSGAIKNAKITKSSGIKEIDTLAKQNAYKASPYPKPPTEDMQKGFKYSIPITHIQVSKNN